MRALRYEILRGVEANGRKQIDMPDRPVRVATLLDEARFLENHELIHNSTVFIEERHHDWLYQDGKFSYYSRVAKVADVLVVYELAPEPGLTPRPR